MSDIATDFEKLGVFYLGRRYDLSRGETTNELLLYESRDMLTHAVCIGMTGSGKTGLCLTFVEEAAIDSIPVIAIDPKGDLSNALLTFPNLSPQEFRPWISEEEARVKQISAEDFAAQQSQLWTEGLRQWGQTAQRVQKLRESAEFRIYTPGSSAGLPISIVQTLAAPKQEILDDTDAFRDLVASTASCLLSLVGTKDDPLRSREHILLSNILSFNWKEGKDLSLPAIIGQIQKPPMKQVGAIDMESFYPAKERFEMAMSINNLLAAPGFDAWLTGESLNVERLFYSPEGKPRVSIMSISHLNDVERMFFVSLLLTQIVSWMRSQTGTSSLRAILYMDEIFGYMPPVKNPPSKQPMLTLLKQARAYGLGLLLASQNPVDLDYKALSNSGSWFIGRLQTERDKMRVLDGLEGAAAEAGSDFNRGRMEQILAGLHQRQFLMNNVHEKHPEIFESRWTMSYLRGPLSRAQIKQLMDPIKKASQEANGHIWSAGGSPAPGAAASDSPAAGVANVWSAGGSPAPDSVASSAVSNSAGSDSTQAHDGAVSASSQSHVSASGHIVSSHGFGTGSGASSASSSASSGASATGSSSSTASAGTSSGSASTGTARFQRASEGSSSSNSSGAGSSRSSSSASAGQGSALRPTLPPDIQEYFWTKGVAGQGPSTSSGHVLKPYLFVGSVVHFVDPKKSLDQAVPKSFILEITTSGDVQTWSSGREVKCHIEELSTEPPANALFGELPHSLAQPKNYKKWGKDALSWLEQTQKYYLLYCPSAKTYSLPGETEAAFRIRLQQKLTEKRDQEVQKLRQKYSPKLATLQEKIKAAQFKADSQRAQMREHEIDSAINVGATILGAMIGRKPINTSTIGRATSAARGVGKATRKKQEAELAEETAQSLQAQLDEMESDFKAELSKVAEGTRLTDSFEPVAIAAKKSNIQLQAIGILWMPE